MGCGARKKSVLALAFVIGLVSVALIVRAMPDQMQEAARLLAGRALGQTPLLDDLEELCDRIGGRPTGSKACERAVDWAAAKFRAAGVGLVATEAYTIPDCWQPGEAEAECLAPEHFPIRLAACPATASIPGGRALEASLVDAGEGTAEAFARLGDKARGAIVLVHSDEMKTEQDLFKEYSRDGPLLEAAQKAGVAALLLQSTRPRGLLYRHPLTLSKISPIPAATVSREHAARLARLAQKGEVRLRLRLANQIGGPCEARNVVAEIRGREKADEVVLLGAHLDSWDLGTGAEDNGVNAALVIDVARAMKELRLVPRRTVRFVLFTGEEQGMLGSEAYVKRHAGEIDRHVAMLTFDTGSGRTTGFYLNGRGELRKTVNEALAAVAGLEAAVDSTEAIDGTDNFDFLLSGVPNLVANQDWVPYLPNYHAESDVFDWVNGREAKVNDAIAAVLVWGLAENPEPPAPHQTRQEVEQLLKTTRLDEQMKALGQWDEWVSGKRGVGK
jgi:Zn-dependent M28 family amino/carboxypeptidase